MLIIGASPVGSSYNIFLELRCIQVYIKKKKIGHSGK